MPAICPECGDHHQMFGERKGPPSDEEEWEVYCEGCGWSDTYIKKSGEVEEKHVQNS